MEDEWYPKPGDLDSTRTGTFVVDPSKNATPAIDISSAAECHRMTIVTGVPASINMDNARTDIMSVFASKDHELISRVEYKMRGTVVVVCKDWTSCKHLTNTYQKAKFQGHELSVSMFSEVQPLTDPSPQ